MDKIAELEFGDKGLEKRWSSVKEDFWGDKIPDGHCLKKVIRNQPGN